MNIKKSSLIESYSFLFEEDKKTNKKIKLVVDPKRNFGNLGPASSPEDLITGLITLDIVFSNLQGEKQTLLQKAFAGIDKDDTSPFKGMVVGKTLDFKKIKSTDVNISTQYPIVFGDYVDSSSRPVLRNLGLYYSNILRGLSASGATRIMLEAKQNVIKLSRTQYVLLLNRLSRQKSFFPIGSNRNLRVDNIFDFIKDNLQNILKTTLDAEGKFSPNQDFVESTERQKIALAFLEAVKATSPGIQKNLGKERIQICITSILDEKMPLETAFKNLNDDLQQLKRKPSQELMKSFQDIITGNINFEAETPEDAIKDNLPQIEAAEETIGDDVSDDVGDGVGVKEKEKTASKQSTFEIIFDKIKDREPELTENLKEPNYYVGCKIEPSVTVTVDEREFKIKEVRLVQIGGVIRKDNISYRIQAIYNDRSNKSIHKTIERKDIFKLKNIPVNLVERFKEAFPEQVDEKDFSESKFEKELNDLDNNLKKAGATNNQISKIQKSVKKDAENLKSTPSLDDINSLAIIKKLKETLYKKDSSFDDPSKLFYKSEIEKIKTGDSAAIKEFKLRNSQIIKPDTSLILKAIKEIVNDPKAKQVFDSVFLGRKKFNEEAFKKAYTGIIVSAFDKTVRVEEGNRIAEGLLNEGIGNWAKTLGMLAATGAGVWIGGVPGAVILGTLSTMRLVKSLYNARKFEKERAEYKKSPHGYIEKKIFANNLESKKAVEAIVNDCTLDELIKVFYPAYNKDKPASTTSGSSDYIKKYNKQKEIFKSFDDSKKQELRDLNQKVLNEFKNIQYYQKGIVNDSVVNSIFNELFLGENRLNDETVKKILEGNLKKSDIAEHVMQPLLEAIKVSPVKNRFVQHINNIIRNKSKKIQLDRFKFKRQTTIEKEFMDEIIGSIVDLNNPDVKNLLQDNKSNSFFENFNSKYSLSLLLEEDQEDEISSSPKQEETKERAEDRKHEIAQSLIGLLSTLKLIDTLKIASYMQTRGVSSTQIANTAISQVQAYFANPAAAQSVASAGIDGIHNVVKLANGKIMVGYYSNIASTVGKPEALSCMIVDPATGVAKMIGRGKSLFSWFAKNKQVLPGVDIDSATGTMSAIKGGTQLAINDPDVGVAFLTIKNNLLGAVPGIKSAVDAKVEMVSLFSDLQANMDFSGIGSVGEFSEQYFNIFFGRASSYYVDGNLSLIRSTGNDYLDSFAKGFAERLVKAKALAPEAAQSAIDKFTAESGKILDNVSLQQTYTAAGVDSVETLEKAQSAASQQFESLWNQTFGQLEIPSDAKEKALKSTVRYLSNPESQQGLNLGLDKITQTTTTYTTKAGASPELYTPPSPDLAAALTKFASMSALSAAMFNFFRQRGINGGVFGKQFYEIFKPQKFVFYDLVNILMKGKPVCIAAPVEDHSEEGLKLLSLDGSEDLTKSLESNIIIPNSEKSSPNLLLREEDQQSDTSTEVKANENFVYKNKLSQLLFEDVNIKNTSKNNLEKEWLKIWDINK